jgi:hypothetical protein
VLSEQLSQTTMILSGGRVCWRSDRMVSPMVAASSCAGISAITLLTDRAPTTLRVISPSVCLLVARPVARSTP